MHRSRTHHQAQKVVKHRNSHGNDPCDDPEAEGNANPGANGDEVLFMHMICASKDTDVNSLESNMSIDNSRDDNLDKLAFYTHRVKIRRD